MNREEAISEWTFRSNHIKKWLNEFGEEPSIRHYVELIDMAIEALNNQPILCKDCKHGREACGNIECNVDLNAPSEYHGYSWFCPCGERKEP